MTAAARPTDVGFSPWQAVVGFGVVSLAADMVYEGARSVTGPLLASLGASAVLVGLVTGAGEAAALVLRLVFGPLADRSGSYWTLTLVGYTLTAVCVPLLAVTPFLGGAGLTVACVLLLAERTGKAIRSPSKSALLAQAAAHVGMGRGLGVHKALDQVGAFAGPLLVAALIAVTGAIWPAMLALAVPGAVAVALLVWLQRRTRTAGNDPAGTQAPEAAKPDLRDVLRAGVGSDLPRAFFRFAYSSAATTAGLVTFGVISFHLTTEQLLPVAAIPVVYAAGMAAAAVAALVTGFSYDRHGGRVLYVLPPLVTAVPALAFSSEAAAAVVGVLVWGAGVGLQDSTVKALVADLVPGPRLATAYGVFAAIQGGAAVIGGAAAGYLYSRSVPLLVAVVALTQVVALVLLVHALRDRRTPD
jgi:MFS family permease